jgi:phosphonate transport system permease protein
LTNAICWKITAASRRASRSCLPRRVSVAPVAPGATATPRLPPRPSAGRSRVIAYGAIAGVIALLIFSWIDVGGSVSQFFHGLFGPKGIVRDVIPHSLPPDLSALWGGVRAAVVTMSIAVLSIAFGLIGAIAMLPLAARTITPSRWLYELACLVQAILRTIPELIMLLFFLITVGFSPFAAVVALTFHGIGVKGKLFAEAVEEMDMAPVDALRVAGASRLQVFLHAVLPGVRNTLLALTMYRLDANFRSAVTLGAVGGGGIGFLIENELSVFQFKVVCTYMIVLVAFVLAIERISTILRARLNA